LACSIDFFLSFLLENFVPKVNTHANTNINIQHASSLSETLSTSSIVIMDPAADASRDGPPLLRPIPRRPFVIDLKCPTPQSLTPPQEDESDNEEQRLEDEIQLARFRRDLINSGLLGSRPSPPDSPPALTQSLSTANLNSSTLAGIYDCSDQDEVFNGVVDGEELHTPWGTGAETPVKRRESISLATYELMRDRSNLPHRRMSYKPAEATPLKQPVTRASAAVSLASRAVVLFVLGAGYGVLVTHLRQESRLLQLPEASHIIPRYNGSYLELWGFGLTGVALGALQPWFDGLWDNLFGSESEEVGINSKESLPEASKQAAPDTDWALVMRAVGVFVGVVFAVVSLKTVPSVVESYDVLTCDCDAASSCMDFQHAALCSRSLSQFRAMVAH
jgi:hypothetical protein